MNENADVKVGAVSLWASILGIVAPILIALLVQLWVKTNDEPYYRLCLLLFAGTELIALVTGIFGRKSTAGRAGLGIALACVALTAVAIPMLTFSQVNERSSQQQPAR